MERYHDIEVTYYNEQGEKITKQVQGFTARDIQHECDHLDGFTLLNRDNLNETENSLVDFLFTTVGDGTTFTTEKLKFNN